MGLKLVTDEKGPIKIFVKEKSYSGGTFNVYSTSVSQKTKDGAWQSAWFDVRFPKSADVSNITNKCEIEIQNAFFGVSEYNGKTTPYIMVMEFTVKKQGEPPKMPSDDFMQIPEGADSELPFK